MANSKFEYVKQFEQPDSLLPNTWIVVRLDGRGFTKYVPSSFLKDIFSLTNKETTTQILHQICLRKAQR